MDITGNVDQYYRSTGDGFLGVGAFCKYSDNEFYFVSGYEEAICSGRTQIHPMVGIMDSLGHISDLKRYQLNEGCGSLPIGIIVTSNKNIITWGWEYSFFALKVDSDLTHVWSKHFDRHGSFQFIRELPGGDLIAGINMDTAGAVVARLSPNGDFIWCKSYIRPKGMVHDCIVESDTSFIITGYTDSTASTNGFATLPPNYHPKLFVMKLNGTGEVQWCKGYDSDPLWYSRYGLRIVKAHDGNYVLLANIGVQGHNLPYRPFLMKTDQNGDTLWTRSMGAQGYTYETSELLSYSDGGFLYDGIIYGDLPGMNTGLSYIVKTDSLGHLPCIEKSHPVSLSDLFPSDSSFTLSSVDGAIALPAYVHDTTFAPIVVYDACEVANGVPHMMRPKQHFTVRPNPNTGRFTMEFKDPLAAESYYSVYDTMGRLLYQRPLPSGKTTEEIDLSRFGKGTYLVKVTDKGGVCFERVVVE